MKITLPNAKAPPPEDWQRLSKDQHAELLEGHDGNIGWRLDSVCVIDPDNAAAQELCDALEADGTLPKTVCVRTWRGMTHRYYSLPVEGPVKPLKISKDGIELELRTGCRQYCIAPGSTITKNGSSGEYTWLEGRNYANIEIKPFPMKAYKRLLKMRGSVRKQADRKVPEVVREGARNQTIFDYACQCRNNGMTLNEAEVAARTINQTRCKPPMADTEIKKTVSSAFDGQPAKKQMGVAATLGEDVPKPFQVGRETANWLNQFHRTEAENGYAFQRLTKGRVKFLVPPGKRSQKYDGWAVWTGKYWQRNARDKALALMRRVAATQLYAAALVADEDYRNTMVRWARGSMQDGRMTSSLHQASLNTKMRIEEPELNQHRFLLNTQSGVVDLKTGELRPHDHKLMMTQISPLAYDPTAKCPMWLKHLGFCFSGDDQIIEHIQRLCGYMLIGHADKQRWWLFLGEGQNGKTTIIETMRLILGTNSLSGYAKHLNSEALQLRNRENYEIAQLQHKRLVDCNEFGEGKINIKLLNGLCDGSTVSARTLYEESFEFVPRATFVVCSNQEPKIEDPSFATWRRILKINFPNIVPADVRVEKYWEHLIGQEGEGILNWAVQGAVKLCRSGLKVPGSVEDDTRQYQLFSNPIDVWMKERCERRTGFKETAEALFASYEEFAKDRNAAPLTTTSFGRAIKTYGLQSKKERHSGSDRKIVTYYAIRLKP